VRVVRATGRLVAFLVWCALGLAARLLTLPVIWVAPGAARPCYQVVCRAWARGLARIVGLAIDVRGRPPAAPFILVANHLGYLDIVTLMAVSPAVFVSRGDLRSWPVLGVLARAAGTLFVDRDMRRDVVRINGLIEQVLARGLGLIIFPEGTSSGGEEVLPFRSSLLEPAVALGRPVHWGTLEYRAPDGGPPASEVVCWWRDMTFVGHFWNLLGLSSIRATVQFGEEPLTADTRHELARRLHEAVSGQMLPAEPARV
jgi:1-acyl-sn-glycerol-3-phosphate acyltransferase